MGVTAFTHVHYVNGVMIVHSHPCKDSHHKHTKSQLVVINHLASFHTYEPATSFRLFINRCLLASIDCAVSVSPVKDIHLKNNALRAPPAILS